MKTTNHLVIDMRNEVRFSDLDNVQKEITSIKQNLNIFNPNSRKIKLDKKKNRQDKSNIFRKILSDYISSMK